MYVVHGRRHGFSNSVRKCDDERIIREALTEEARASLVRQFQFLPWLAQRLPLAIPVPESLTHNALIYRNLPGRTLTPQLVSTCGETQVAAQLSEFIAALHVLPVADCVAAGVTQENRTEGLLRAFERTLGSLSPVQKREAEAWRKQFVAADSSAVMIHGDLWFENILIDPHTGRLSGVLDFDEASIGDPAWDLATQLHLGAEFFRLVLESYPNKSTELRERAHSLFQLRCFEGLDIAIRRGDRAEAQESIEKLRRAQVLS